MKVTSSECISELQSLLNCPSKISAVRDLQGNEAQTFANFLDQVSKLCASYFRNSRCLKQVLAHSRIDDKSWRRGLWLLSKICKARGIIPAPYILRPELIRVGSICSHSRFAYVCNGEYSGCPVAIKHIQAASLKMNKGESDRTFKVCLIDHIYYHCSTLCLSPSGYVERSLVGNICPIRTSCPCWGFPFPEIHIGSAFSLNGCQTGM